MIAFKYFMVNSRVIYLIAIIKFNELKFYCVYVYATRFHFQRFPSLEIIIILRFPLETLATFVYLHNSFFLFFKREHVKFSWKIFNVIFRHNWRV